MATKRHDPSLIVLSNFIQIIGRDGVRILLHHLREGRTYDEIAQIFPGAGFSPANLSRRLPRVFFQDWFLHPECEQFLDLLNQSEQKDLEYERKRLRLVVGRIDQETTIETPKRR